MVCEHSNRHLNSQNQTDDVSLCRIVVVTDTWNAVRKRSRPRQSSPGHNALVALSQRRDRQRACSISIDTPSIVPRPVDTWLRKLQVTTPVGKAGVQSCNADQRSIKVQ